MSFKKTGGEAVGDGGVVGGSGIPRGLEDALDGFRSDLAEELGDGAVCVEWEGVACFGDREAGGRVLEGLDEGSAGAGREDMGVERDGDEREVNGLWGGGGEVIEHVMAMRGGRNKIDSRGTQRGAVLGELRHRVWN